MVVVTCDYKVGAPDGRGLLACGRASTHLCLVESIGEPGPQSRTENRCATHADNRFARDVIEAFTHEEVARWE